MRNILLAASLSALLPGVALAQTQTVLLPGNATAVPSGGFDNISWGSYRPTGWTGLRMQVAYARENFAMRGIGGRIELRGVRFRSGPLASLPLGSANVGQVTLFVSTSQRAADNLSTTYSQNTGADNTYVFYGSVPVQAAASAGVPQAYIPFSTPFVYDWTRGDLLFDINYPFSTIVNTPAGTSPRYGDAMSSGGGLLYSDWFAYVAAGTYAGVPVVEFDYVVVPGSASAISYGAGCTDLYASFGQAFSPTGSVFDLANTRVAVARQPANYVATRGAGALATGAFTTLTLGDDTCSAPLLLPFAFPYFDRHGVLRSTIQIVVASNGYIWLDPAQTSSDASPSASELVAQAPRLAAHWCDLVPNLGGTVSYGTSANGEFHVTWDQVPEYQHPTNLATVQLSLASNGNFRIDYGAANPGSASITAWSPGLGARALQPRDLSALGSATFGIDASTLALHALARPVLGSTMPFVIDNIPTGSYLGVLCFGLFPAQVDLTPFGMTGCTRWATWDAKLLLFPGSNSVTFNLPITSNPAMVGLPLNAQAAMFVPPGYNPTGILTSNGVATVVGSN